MSKLGVRLFTVIFVGLLILLGGTMYKLDQSMDELGVTLDQLDQSLTELEQVLGIEPEAKENGNE